VLTDGEKTALRGHFLGFSGKSCPLLDEKDAGDCLEPCFSLAAWGKAGAAIGYVFRSEISHLFLLVILIISAELKSSHRSRPHSQTRSEVNKQSFSVKAFLSSTGNM